MSHTTYRNAAQVRARYGGISDMTLWRWLHDEELGFPQPIRINGRRFWSEEALNTWEGSHAAAQSLRDPGRSGRERSPRERLSVE
jgi:predicted DNA-binding transcriptional regulator AlpA